VTNVDKLAITVPYGEGFKEKLHDTDVRANCGMCNQRNIIKTICKRIRIGLVHEDMGYTITTRSPAVAEGPRDAGVPVEIW